MLIFYSLLNKSKGNIRFLQKTWFPKFKIWASTPDAHHGLIFDARVIKDHQHIYLSGVKKQAKNTPCQVSFGYILSRLTSIEVVF